MVDANALLRAWILSSTAITTIVGNGNLNGGVYCVDLPEKFDPKLGPGITIARRGGQSHCEISGLVDARMQVKVWTDVEQYELAGRLYSAIYDWIHGGTGVTMNGLGTVVRCIEVTPGQDLDDPDTGWSTIVSFYQLMARA